MASFDFTPIGEPLGADNSSPIRLAARWSGLQSY